MFSIASILISLSKSWIVISLINPAVVNSSGVSASSMNLSIAKIYFASASINKNFYPVILSALFSQELNFINRDPSKPSD